MNAHTATVYGATVDANTIFPDRPMKGHEMQDGRNWHKSAGKPFTLAEKRAILGDAYMIPANVTTLKPVRHEPTVRVISTKTVDGATVEHVAIGACQTAQTAPVQDARPVDPVMESGSYGEEIIVERMERVKLSRELDARLTVHAAASVAARVCPSCGTPAEPTDKFCAECGARLTHEATAHEAPRAYPEAVAEMHNSSCPCEPCQYVRDVLVPRYRGHESAPADPAQEHADAIYDAIPADVIRSMRAKYSARNCARIFAACPHATEVRGFHEWIKAGRAVQKGQKGIKILAPVTRKTDSGESVVNVKPAYVFDVSQTAPIAPKQPRASQPDGTSYAAAD